MSEQTQYIVRVQSDFAYSYGLGESVVPGVTLFRAGNYNLSQDELNFKLLKATLPKKVNQ
jgi:hypothetical protein